jgi:hypothetical protein
MYQYLLDWIFFYNYYSIFVQFIFHLCKIYIYGLFKVP